MSSRHDVRAFALAAALFVGVPLRAAEPTPGRNKAIAEALFEQARVALKEGRYADACRQLGESHRLDAATGTLLNLAVCHELEGKIATAWAEYTEVIALTRKEAQSERRAIAEERAQVLGPRLSYLTLLPPIAAVEGLVVTLDRVPISPAAWNMPLPMDPGTHSVEARAPGRLVWRATAQIDRDAQRRTLRIGLLPLAREPAAPRSDARTAPGRLQTSPTRTIGAALLGAGVLAAGAGAYFALRANGAWSERNRHCRGGECDARAVEAWRSASRFASFADLAFAGSLIAGGAGSYLLLVPLEAADADQPTRSGFAPGLVVRAGGRF